MVAPLNPSKGRIHVPMAAGKLVNKNARPVSAGLKTFAPIPPKKPLATTMAKIAPKTVIQTGRVGGKTNANINPVTTAERSLILTFCFVAIWKTHSAKTAVATETKIVTKAGIPKRITPYTAKGNKAMITQSITMVVFLLVET